MKSNSLTGIVLVGITVWLLFFGGCSAVQRATTGYATNGASVVGAIQTGVQRTLATPAPQIVVPAAPQAPAQQVIIPQAQATPAPVFPTAVVVAPAPPVQVAVVPLTPTPAPPTATPPTPTAQYPSVDLKWEMRADGCLYVLTVHRRLCPAAPDVPLKTPATLAGLIEAGLLGSEPIPGE